MPLTSIARSTGAAAIGILAYTPAIPTATISSSDTLISTEFIAAATAGAQMGAVLGIMESGTDRTRIMQDSACATVSIEEITAKVRTESLETL